MARTGINAIAIYVRRICRTLNKYGAVLMPTLPSAAAAALIALQGACNLIVALGIVDVE